MANFIKTLAGDLLNLEVNTIIKENSSSAKIPTSKRVALHQIAEKYRDFMIGHGLAINSPREGHSPPPGANRKRVFRWGFGGEYSFVEIMIHANSAMEELSWKEAQAPKESDRAEFEKVRLMLDRIASKSSNIVGLFKMRRKEFSAEIDEGLERFENRPDLSIFQASESYPSQAASGGWNNDLSLDDINQVDDIDLTPEHITLIRKVWEIGMEQVLLQTSIQIDGDITSIISKDFIRMPDRTKEMVMNVHNDSISSSTHIWKMLFETIGKLAGKTFNKIFERTKKA